MLTVEDDELVGAFLDMVENHKMIVENSGLLTVAALKQLDLKGKKAVAILSGGSMDVITMSSIVQHGADSRETVSFRHLYYFRINRDSLRLLLQTIADAQGNVIRLGTSRARWHQTVMLCRGASYYNGSLRYRA